MSFNDDWLKNGLPTYRGGKDKPQARQMLDRMGGPQGFKTAQRTDADGSVTTVQTRGDMPPQVFTTRPSKIIIAPVLAARGWVAHIVAAIKAALFSPYTLSISNPNYTVFKNFYTVLPFHTSYNTESPDILKWHDVLSFYKSTILVNGKSMPGLGISSVPINALPWLIPHAGSDVALYGDAITNGYEKRVFAVSRDKVHSWMGGGVDAVLNNPTARPDKALMCGAKIEPVLHKAWISQFAFTGLSWDAVYGRWAFTSAHISMLLTPPYLTKVDAGMEAEQPYYVPTALTPVYITNHRASLSFPNAEIAVTGNAVLGSSAYAVQNVNYPVNNYIEGPVAGYEIGTLTGSPYSAMLSTTVALRDKTINVAWSCTFNKARVIGQAKNDVQIIPVIPSPAPTYVTIMCYNNGNTSSQPLEFGTRGNSSVMVGGFTSAVYSDHYQENSDVSFSIGFGITNLVAGTATRHKSYGSVHTVAKTTWASDMVVSGNAYYTMTVLADTYYVPVAPAITLMNSTAASFVGQPFIWRGDTDGTWESQPHFTTTVNEMSATDDQTLNWSTKDFLLYDETNGCYISVDSVFAGAQAVSGLGIAALTINLTIITPLGTTVQTLFTTPLTFSNLLPKSLLAYPLTYVPSPQLRVIFTPLFQEQGDFKGAAYTTSAEVANGATAAYLFNFVLKLDTYSAIGTDTSIYPTINFIPCNLIEMLYAYVYSSKYGVDPYTRYPVDNVSRFNDFQASLFTNQWRVNYRDGVLIDWLDTLGGTYIAETTTELYRV